MSDDRNANVVLTADTSNYSQQMVAAASSTNQVTDSVNKLINSVDRLMKNSGRKLELVGATTIAGLTGATLAAAKFEQQMSTLQATAAITGNNINSVSSTVDSLRRNLPVSTSQVIALASALQKLGVSNQGLKPLADTFVRLSSATGEDLGSLATAMVQLQRQMGTTEGSTAKFANVVASLSANLGTSATGILQFSQSLAPVARSVGMTQTEIMGISAAFQKSGQDGYAAANVFNKLLTDISRASRYGSNDIFAYANAVGMTADSFKKLPASQQTLQFFQSISKGGADAIKTLERLGYDGPRAMKAIQGMSQSGGLAKALGLADTAFNDTGSDNALGKGSKAAMDGLNDSLTVLKNNLTSIGQAMGSTFLPFISKAVDGMAGLASAVRTAIGPFTALLGVLGLSGGAVSGIAGMALSNFGTIAAAAGAFALMRNPLTAGLRGARAAATGGTIRSPFLARANERLSRGEGSPMQQRLYGWGQRAGNLQTAAMNRIVPGSGEQSARGMFGSVLGRGAMLASGMFQTGVGLAGGAIDPVRWRAAGDMLQRGRNPVASGRDAYRSAMTGEGATIGNALRGSAAAVARFTVATTDATLGLARLAGQATLGAVRGVGGAMLGGVGRAGGALLGAMGGPAGLAIMGGFAGAAYLGSANNQSKDFRDSLNNGQAADSAVNRYASALGIAASATMTFADTVNKSSGQINGEADSNTSTSISPNDVKNAKQLGRTYTDPMVSGLNENEATQYAKQVFSVPGTDPKIQQAMKLDLVQKFGAEKAGQIIKGAQTAPYDASELIDSGYNPWQVWEQIKPSKHFNSTVKRSADTTNTLLSQVNSQFGSGESDKLTVASVNAMLKNFYGGSQGQGTSIASGIESILGGKVGFDQGDIYKLSNSDDPAAQQRIFKGILDRAAKGGNGTARNYLDALSGLAPEAASATTYQMPQFGTEKDLYARLGAYSTVAGGMVSNEDQLGGTIRGALAAPDNANSQLAAATQWAQSLVSMKGSTTGANAELQRLKAVIQDTTDPLYQMAQAAQTAAQRLQGYRQGYQSTSQNVRDTTVGLAAAYAGPKDAPDYQQNVTTAEDAYESQRQGVYGQMKNIVKAKRDFDISQGRAQEDFDLQRARADQQFDLQRKYSEQDYNTQRSRSEIAFQLQRNRGEQDYQLSKKRGEEDYNLTRKRGDDDYNLSRKRAQNDFDLQQKRGADDYARQMKRSQSDFSLSRKRSEEDYHHQVDLMVKATAKNMQSVYERVTIKPSWDASNLLTNSNDQLKQMQQQQSDLAKLKKMGISDDVVSQLGLTDFANQQQLARFVSDMAEDPSLVEKWNKSAKGKLDIAKLFVTNSSSDEWKEMEYQFNKTADRAEADFKRMTKRGSEDYERGVARMTKDYNKMVTRGAEDYEKSKDRMSEDYEKMVTRAATDYSTATSRMSADYKTMTNQGAADYEKMTTRMNAQYKLSVDQTTTDWNTQMKRAKDDLSRSFEEVTGTFSDLEKEAMGALSGVAKNQMSDLVSNLGKSREAVKKAATGTADDIVKAFKPLFGGDEKKTRDALGLPKHQGPTNPENQVHGGGGHGSEQSYDSMSSGAIGGSDLLSGVKEQFPLPKGSYHFTSPFGMRTNPVTGLYRLHAGMDFGAPKGTPIGSWEPGVVTSTGARPGLGNMVEVTHNKGLKTWYGHMSHITAQKGQMVNAGTEIGKVGSTGNSTGNHLHFEVHVNGTAVNPAPFLKGVASGKITGGGGGGGASALDLSKSKHLEAAENALTDMAGSTYNKGSLTTALQDRYSAMNVNSQTDDTWYGHGGIFTGARRIGVGERGTEMVIPLNSKGSDFLAQAMSKFAAPSDKYVHGGRITETKSTYISQKYDQHTDISGEITVQAQDPEEFLRKLEERKRMQALTRPRSRT